MDAGPATLPFGFVCAFLFGLFTCLVVGTGQPKHLVKVSVVQARKRGWVEKDVNSMGCSSLLFPENAAGAPKSCFI